MRWPFSAAAPAPAPAPEPAPAPVAVARAWEGVPVLRPQALSLRPVARSSAFVHDLSTRSSSPVVLRAPEHLVDGGPVGVVRAPIARSSLPVTQREHVEQPPPRVSRWRRSAA